MKMPGFFYALGNDYHKRVLQYIAGQLQEVDNSKRDRSSNKRKLPPPITLHPNDFVKQQIQDSNAELAILTNGDPHLERTYESMTTMQYYGHLILRQLAAKRMEEVREKAKK